MAIGRDQRFGQADDGFEIKEAHVGRAGLKEAVGEDQLAIAGIVAIRVVFQRPVEVGAQFGAPVGRQHIFEKEIAILVKGLDPALDLFRAGRLAGEIGGHGIGSFVDWMIERGFYGFGGFKRIKISENPPNQRSNFQKKGENHWVGSSRPKPGASLGVSQPSWGVAWPGSCHPSARGTPGAVPTKHSSQGTAGVAMLKC